MKMNSDLQQSVLNLYNEGKQQPKEYVVAYKALCDLGFSVVFESLNQIKARLYRYVLIGSMARESMNNAEKLIENLEIGQTLDLTSVCIARIPATETVLKNKYIVRRALDTAEFDREYISSDPQQAARLFLLDTVEARVISPGDIIFVQDELKQYHFVVSRIETDIFTLAEDESH